MLTTVIVAMLAAGAGGSTQASPAYDPNRMICKRSDEPGSRIQRRKVCATVAEWAERKRIEMQNLLEKQRNGAQ